ncbi:MAG TPA: hypothetical protein VJL38_01200 [Patescibacteria group bacterium]|nr:hypothetical protein [Patescibacteria group bacterium]
MKKVNGGVETHALQRFRGQYFPDVPEAAAREILRACKKGLGERTGTIFITHRTCREAGYAESTLRSWGIPETDAVFAVIVEGAVITVEHMGGYSPQKNNYKKKGKK